MLTKELIQYSIRKDRLYPVFIDTAKPSLVHLAKDLCAQLAKAKGVKYKDLENLLDQISDRGEKIADSLKKLTFDECEFEEVDENVLEKRWQIFAAAEELRAEQLELDPDEFQQRIADRIEYSSPGALKEALFADHPFERKCVATETITPDQLLESYNRANFQSLFMFADRVTITVTDATLVEKRALFRSLKFHNLMSEVTIDPNAHELILELSGPLRLFNKSSTYGLHLAKFIPNVLHLKKWSIQAEIKLKQRSAILSIDHTTKLVPKGRGLQGYVPEEFQQVLIAFNASQAPLVMEPSEEFLHLGKNNFCFPDFQIKRQKKLTFIEIFHPWHRGQLVHRLKTLTTMDKKPSLVLAIEKSLVQKDQEIKSLLEQFSDQHYFTYGQFPTSKQLAKALGEL
jgi:uncharacterized protein